VWVEVEEDSFSGNVSIHGQGKACACERGETAEGSCSENCHLVLSIQPPARNSSFC
jgi:hypothetical protein